MSKIEFIKRYQFIIEYVKRRPYCTKKDLLSKLNDYMYINCIENGTSTRTLTRDINKDIPDIFGLEIKYCTIKRGYYISRDDFEYSNASKILESFDIISSMNIQNGAPDFIIFEKRRGRGTEYLTSLSKAIRDRFIVTFEYKKFYPEITEIRAVEPYILKESRGRWYLLGFDNFGDKTITKTFGLDRISGLDITSQKYEPIKNIDWANLYSDCFAMFTDEKPQKVVFKLDHRDGNYVESMPIHHSQKLTKYSDHVVIELYISITLDFIMELMSRSWSIEIVEPVSLKEKMSDIYKDALKRNCY